MNCVPTTALPRSAAMSRGNTLVLVTAILVLLAIVAVAYLSRTQAGRSTAAAQQLANSRGERIDALSDNLAQVISEALFVRPADPADPWLQIPPDSGSQMPTPSPSRPRGAVDPNAHRYSIDALDLFNTVEDADLDGLLTAALGGDGIPEGYNYAPYVVQAWTNWPDVFGVFPGDGNPAGNPSYGDSRWLRSAEPVRQLISPNLANPPIPNGSPFGDFTHWQHLSWLPTADNGWRLVTDLKDVDLSLAASIAFAPQNLGSPLIGQAGWALDMPYEQWLPDAIPDVSYRQHLNGSNGSLLVAQQFRTHAQLWFANYYNLVGANPPNADPLPNFFRLASWGPPTDEYVDGSPRQLITRTLADADGDGFTDSYWFLAPTSTDRGVRQAVAVSITDNSALVNANVATRFDRRTSFGATPADVALVGSMDLIGGNLNDFDLPVGLFTDPANQPEAGTGAIPSANFLYPPTRVRYDEAMYGAASNASSPSATPTMVLTGDADNPTFLRALGAVRQTTAGGSSLLDAFRYQLRDANERVRWFKAMGQDGEVNSWINPDDTASGGPGASVFLRTAGGDPPARLRPFDESDEIELRMYASSNNASVLSRFERAVQRTDALGAGADANPDTYYDFLRASNDRLETLDELDWQAAGTSGQWTRFRRLNAQQLLRDNRRKLTLFSGARNEMLPPWLWTTPRGNFDFQTGVWSYLSGCSPTQVWPAPAVAPNASAQASVGYIAGNGYSRNDWLAWNRKVDLRQAAVEPIYDPSWTLTNGSAMRYARTQFLNQMSRVLERSLLDPPVDVANPNEDRATYFGIQEPGSSAVLTTRRMVASWAANIETFRDPPKVQPDGSFVDHPFHPSEAYTIQEDVGGSESRSYIGYEKQPYIQEVFFALVYPNSTVPPGWPTAGQEQVPPGYPSGGEQFVTYDVGGGDDQQPAVVLAVQIANPHHEPIQLQNFAVRAFGQTFRFGQLASTGWGYGVTPVLGPATETAPRSAIVFCCPKQLSADTAFRAKWMDFLDITHEWLRSGAPATAPTVHPYPSNLQAELAAAGAAGFQPWPLAPDQTETDLFEDATTAYPDTMVFNATQEPGNIFGRWDEGTTQSGVAKYRTFIDGTTSPTVELLRTIIPLDPVNGVAEIVVDRLENEFNADAGDFRDALTRLLDATGEHVPPPPSAYDAAADPTVGGTQTPTFNGVRLGTTGDFFCTWVRVARPWSFDTDKDGAFELSERAPRFVVASGARPIRVTDEQKSMEGGSTRPKAGSIWDEAQDPDGAALATPQPWFATTTLDIFGRLVRGKPTNFNSQGVYLGTTGTDRLSTAFNYPQSTTWGDYSGTSPGGLGGIVVQPGDKGLEPDTATDGQQCEIWRGTLDMTWKDRDFDLIGEVANVFQWGPVLSGGSTYATFSEIMSGEVDEYPIIKGPWVEDDGTTVTATDGTLANRLSFPYDPANANQTDPHLYDPTLTRTMLRSVAAYLPAIPAGCAVFDGFTLDDRGAAYVAGSYAELQQGGSTQAQREASQARAEDRRFRLAMGYTAESTPGLINLNTAILESLNAMPFMRALVVNEQAAGPMWATTGGAGPDLVGSGWDTSLTPLVRVPSSMLLYRDLRGGSIGYDPANTTAPPLYTDRGLVPDQIPGTPGMWAGMRRGQGIWSLGELALLTRTVGQNSTAGYPASGRNWSVQFAGMDPYQDAGIGWYSGASLDARISLDRTPAVVQSDLVLTTQVEPTIASSDGDVGTAEELNMLQSAMSNIASVRSDFFTVHFLVRTFRANSLTGRWDATDPDAVIDESRYVMLVDRTPVDRPGQKPRIRYFTKVP
ncbi:MAG: hypothetical protein O2855_00415 [Planctomycetota bacterium]|nr:hypothetical protein [Planctomycetota bacterium]